jgi:hypothetical protein
MAIALVAETDDEGGSGGATLSAIDTTGASLLIAVLSCWAGGVSAATVPTDSKSNTWTALTARGGAAAWTRIFYSVNPSVGTGHTMTWSDASSFPVQYFAAFSGVDTSSPFDQQNGATGNAPLSTGAVVPSTDGQLIITGFSWDGSSGGITGPSGYTALGSYEYESGGSNEGAWAGYLIQTTAASTNPELGLVNGRASAGAVATFKAAGGGGGRTTKNTRSHPLGIAAGISWRVAG